MARLTRGVGPWRPVDFMLNGVVFVIIGIVVRSVWDSTTPRAIGLLLLIVGLVLVVIGVLAKAVQVGRR